MLLGIFFFCEASLCDPLIIAIVISIAIMNSAIAVLTLMARVFALLFVETTRILVR